MTAHSFVAMGDSFTEGLDDPYPDGETFRGWADLVAEVLAARSALAGGEAFQYANLAIRGRLFDGVVTEQVPVAMAMRPDIFAFAAGGNDALRREFDPAGLIVRFDQTIELLRTTGAEVLVFQFIDLSRRLPGRRVLRPRIEALNNGVSDTAQRHGARVVELWSDSEFDHPRLWSSDRLHLSESGHQRVAARVLAALDIPADPAWLAVPPEPSPVSWGAARRADLRWAHDHLRPWLGRRLTGRSSGDARTPKRPTLSPVNPTA